MPVFLRLVLRQPVFLQREGNYPPPPGASEILGLDIAGIVEQAGSGVGTAAVLDQTQSRGVDLILDFVAAAYWEKNISVLRADGRMVLISLMGGSIAERVDLGQILKKRLQINGTTLRGRPEEYKIRLTREFAEFALDKLAAGRLKPVIDSVFPWEQVADAHTRMEANQNFGKIVLTIN